LELFIGGRAIRIGSPRELPIPGSFPTAIDYLSKAFNEPVGQRDLEKHGSGDDGVDIWLAKGFDDERPSQLLLLTQCSIGEDWQDKRSELDLDLWKRHIDWFTKPQKVFAVPFHHNTNSWRETATRGGLIVDRGRIARLIAPTHLAAPLVTRLRRWTKRRIRITAQRVSA
jgi:hypothetical protein